MSSLFKKIILLLLAVGAYSASAAIAQGPVIVPRDPNSPSIHEGPSGIQSAGYKQGIDPLIGNLPASYDPFHNMGQAIGSLVLPFFHQAPSPADPSLYGFKPTIQQVFPYKYYGKSDVKQFSPGTKGIAGKNVTDVAFPGIPGDKGPGGLYWVGYPRPGNVEIPPPFQTIHHPYDCFCRWDEMIKCPLPESPFWHVDFGAPWFGLHLLPSKCQACFAGHIVKHDFYVGTNKPGVFDGYPFTYPNDPGYQQCLRESTQSYAASGPGGNPVNNDYGL
ncbi:MAG TPA: hypothetical protein VLG69_03100 [Candidatus Andersenbacteria bacterium]|nr:hypothetical protein [Candidatus Andersenbacteria bacterium]